VLKARALELADRMMTDADPSVALDILERLRVVESVKDPGLAFTVQIGISADLGVPVVQSMPALSHGGVPEAF
jgi:hypothetical protein